MSEAYVSISIPGEYVRDSDEPITLRMPVSYAIALGRLLVEGPEAFRRYAMYGELDLSFKRPADETEQEGGNL